MKFGQKITRGIRFLDNTLLLHLSSDAAAAANGLHRLGRRASADPQTTDARTVLPSQALQPHRHRNTAP